MFHTLQTLKQLSCHHTNHFVMHKNDRRRHLQCFSYHNISLIWPTRWSHFYTSYHSISCNAEAFLILNVRYRHHGSSWTEDRGQRAWGIVKVQCVLSFYTPLGSSTLLNCMTSSSQWRRGFFSLSLYFCNCLYSLSNEGFVLSCYHTIEIVATSLLFPTPQDGKSLHLSMSTDIND
jgi:hypothetical protein